MIIYIGFKYYIFDIDTLHSLITNLKALGSQLQIMNLKIGDSMKSCANRGSNAPINVMPHPPPLGHRVGKLGALLGD